MPTKAWLLIASPDRMFKSPVPAKPTIRLPTALSRAASCVRWIVPLLSYTLPSMISGAARVLLTPRLKMPAPVLPTVVLTLPTFPIVTSARVREWFRSPVL